MTNIDDTQPQNATEAAVLGYFLNMKRKDFEAFEALWHEDAVQVPIFRPEGMDHFVSRMEGREQLMTHYRAALANRSGHDFWIDALHATQDPEVFVVECRGRSVVGETGHLYENSYVFVFTLREGKIAHLKEYADPQPIIRAFTGAFD